MPGMLALLRRYLRPHRRRGGVLALLLFGYLGLELANPLWLRGFIDEAVAGAPLADLQLIAVAFITLTVVKQGFTTAANYLGEDVAFRATNAMRADLTAHCLQLDMRFHHAHTPGELVERVDGDVATLSDFFSTFLFSIVGRSVLVVGIMVLSFATDWRVGLVLLAFSVVVLALAGPLQRVVVPRFAALRQANADLTGFLDERLSSTEDIRANGVRAHVERGLDGVLGALLDKQRASAVASRYFSSTLEIGVAIVGAAVLALGALLLQDGSMTLGTVYLSFHYTALLSSNLTSITLQLDGLHNAAAGLRRISELYRERPTIVDGPLDALPPGPLEVRFDDVSFGYTSGVPTLRDVSFDLPPGQTLGVIGRTGSGKSTIARLLCRTYDVADGAVRLGGTDVRESEVDVLRSRIGVVTQDVQVFHASVRDNITMFDRSIPDSRIEHAITELGLGRWYAMLPDGLDTVVAGDSLSAGEAQLLAFTRVLLHDPDVVVLDEASSRLDPTTEQAIESAVTRLLAGRTGIVIAHHLDTVAQADRILLMEDGLVREFGVRTDLLADPGSHYNALRAEAT